MKNLTSKIIITPDSLITDIVGNIKNASATNVLIFIKEGTDIGISVASIKLLKEKAKTSGKKIVIVTTDSICSSIATNLDIVVKDSDRAVKDSDFDFFSKLEEIKATEQTIETSILSKNESDIIEETQVEPVKIEKEEPPKEELNKKTDSGFTMVVGTDIDAYKVNPPLSTPIRNTSITSNYSGTPKILNNNSNSNICPIDGQNTKKAYLNRDWTNVSEKANIPVKKTNEVYQRKGGIKQQFMKMSKAKSFFSVLFTNKFLVFGVIIGILVGVIGFGYYYYLVPRVEIILYPKNISVQYSGEVYAKDNIAGISVTEKIISSKIESFREYSLSKSGDTTGEKTTGNTASGKIAVYNSTDNDVTLQQGTVISYGQLKFKTTESVVVPKRANPIENGKVENVSITSDGIGPEYNINLGVVMSVSTYTADELSAITTTTFTGGTKIVEKVISKEDVEKIGVELETELKSQINQKFKDLHSHDEWVLVEESIKFTTTSEGVERFVTDYPIDSAQSVVNVTAVISATATYYNKNELDSLIAELLNKDYENQKQSGTIGGIVNSTLDGKVNMELTIKEVKENEIKLWVVANGMMRTAIDTNLVQKELKGKSWEDGNKYLFSLPYMDKQPEIIYKPSNYNENLKHYPIYIKYIRVRISQSE